MTEKQSTLSKVQSWAMIFSTIAVPILVAFFGNQIQIRISQESTKKDYVAMAVNIINSKDTPKDSELRRWAVSVLEKSSPVPFGADLKQSLSAGAALLSKPFYPKPPAALMEPALPPKKLEPAEGEDVKLSDLLKNTIENQGICRLNVLKLEALQELVRKYYEITTGENFDDTSQSGKFLQQ